MSEANQGQAWSRGELLTIRGRAWLLSLAALILIVSSTSLVGCGGTNPQRAQQQEVPLKVVEGEGGATLALVPVYIDNQGPFAFALDTGASRSVVDQPLARQLNLPSAGPAGEVTGVAGQTQATLVNVAPWRVGDVQLPNATITSLDLPEPNRGRGLQGLLGSDMLSQFGAVTVDYESQKLYLRSRP